MGEKLVMRQFKYSLIVESKKEDIIQSAFDRARNCFMKVTRIKTLDCASVFSFTIAPDGGKNKQVTSFKVKEQQAFIEWCMKQNPGPTTGGLSVKPHHFGGRW